MKQIIITLILLFCIPPSLYADEPTRPYNPDVKSDIRYAESWLKRYNRNISIVKKKGKYGLKRKGHKGKNEWIIPCEYDAFFCSVRNSNLIFRTTSKTACYNVFYNKVLPKEYNNAYRIPGRWPEEIRSRLQVIQYAPYGALGLYDLKEDKEVAPAQYDYIWLIAESYSPTSYVLLKKGNEYTVYDWVNNKALSTFQYNRTLTRYSSTSDEVEMCKDTYFIMYRSLEKVYEIYNWRKKEVALPANNKYGSVFDSDFLSDRILKVRSKTGQSDYYGYYDLYEKKEIVPPCYKDIQTTTNPRYMWVSKTKKINTSASNPASLYDTQTQVEINLSSYSSVQFIENKNMLLVKKGEHWGIYDLVKKSEIIPPIFNHIESIKETKNFLCKLADSYVLYDEAGKELIPASRGYINVEFQKDQNKFYYRTKRYYGECNRYGNELSRKEIVTFESTWTSKTDNAISFHISNLNIHHLLGHKIDVIFWIADADGNRLKDTNNKYHTNNGHVSTGRIYDVMYTNSIIKQVTSEIPKNEFHLDRNKEHRLLYSIGVYDYTDKNMIREFGYIYPFTLDKAQVVQSQVASSRKNSNQSSNQTAPKPGLLYSGTIYQSMQGYNQTTGQYFGGGPDAVFGVEIYNDYIIVSNSRYNYTRNTIDGSERVYEGTDMLGNLSYYYVNPNTFAMRLVKRYSNSFTGGFDYASYQISNGPTTFQYNNPTYNNSGGYNNNGNSGGNSNTNRNNNNKQRHECSLCHGKKRIVRDSHPPTYGTNDSRVRCNECGGYFLRSTGHSHITCTLCHGRGYLEY